jgi:hypothetical protein
MTGLERFETIGELYYNRFGRLRPGKSEAIETGRSSMDDENIKQFDGWILGNQSFLDAIDTIVELQDQIRSLEQELDDARWGENQ